MESLGLEQDRKNGKAPSSWTKPSARSILNYSSPFGAKEVRHKKETRLVAESSPRSITFYLHTVAESHLHPVLDGVGDRSIEKATAGAKKLYKLVSDANGKAALGPARPQLQLSTDDSGCFISNISGKGTEWKFILDDARGVDMKHKSLCTTEQQSSNSNGFRAGITTRITHTMSGGGITAPIFVQMLHLTQRELPNDVGILIMRVKGLCIGASQDVRIES